MPKKVVASKLPKRKDRDQGIVFQDPNLGSRIDDGYEKVLLMNTIAKLRQENMKLKELLLSCNVTKI